MITFYISKNKEIVYLTFDFTFVHTNLRDPNTNSTVMRYAKCSISAIPIHTRNAVLC